MPSNAQDKLNKAIFFLQRMKESTSDDLAFSSYFDAFLSSARSVTYLIETETKGTVMQTWSKSKWEELNNNDANFHLLMEARNITIHRAVNKTYRNIIINIPPASITTSLSITTADPNGNTINQSIQEPTPPPTPQTTAIIHKWYLEATQDMDIIIRAEKCVDVLNSLMIEYVQLRSTNNLP